MAATVMRWWGWGEDGHAPLLGDAALALLRDELGVGEAVAAAGDDQATRGAARRVELEEVVLPEPGLDEAARRALRSAVSDAHVREDRVARVGHAGGKGYADLVRLRSGDGSRAPDAVVQPSSEEEVAAVLRACTAGGIAVVPFGGGTSVVGGVDALRGRHGAAIALDLGLMERTLEVDPRSLTATVEPGLLGPELERRLAAEGLTLGHFPQSFEHSTVGGWVATRSAGQASTGYGRIDDLVEAVRAQTPAGAMATRSVPASAAGPALRELLVGSEGTLGVLTAATLRVRPAPEAVHYEAWMLPSFEEGAEALRAVAQGAAAPDLARLSDREETRLTSALASSDGARGAPGAVEALGRRYLRLRRRAEGCLMVTGVEGTPDDVARRRGRLADLLRAAGAVGLGERRGQAWVRGRFAAPYLRDELLDRGVLVETFETACSWAALQDTYAGVAAALRGAAPGPVAVMCHLSHLYASGASLYFSVLTPVEAGKELAAWEALKRAALDAMVAAGATISHHHGVGADHAPWMESEVGAVGIDVLRAARERLDPEGIMNPGKLLPEPGPPR